MLNPKLALITGGTGGIGYAIAKILAKDYHLALGYAQNTAKAEMVLKELSEGFPDKQIRIFKQPLASYAEAKMLHEQVSKHFNMPVATLVNATGRSDSGLYLSSDFETHEKHVLEHLLVTMAMSKICIESMYKQRWGRIINISSSSVAHMLPGKCGYTAAMAGIEGFTRNLALEVAHRGITVNCLAPGYIYTDMTKNYLKELDEKGKPAVKVIPAGYVGQPDDVAHAAEFLFSEKARYITGVVLPIDGGMTLGRII